MKVAIVHAADQGRGAEHCVMTLHQGLRAAGHSSELLVGNRLTDEVGVTEIIRDRPIPGLLRVTRWLENSVGIQALYAPWFRALAQTIAVDTQIVHIHSLWGGTYTYADLAGIYYLARRFKTVLTLHDGWMLTGHCACPYGCERWKYGCGKCPDLKRTPAIPYDMTALNWRRKRAVIQKSSLHVTVVSEWLQQQLTMSPIFHGKATSVVHNGFDESVFLPADKVEARKRLGLPLNAFVVLLAGQSVDGIDQGIAQEGVEAINQVKDLGVVALVVGGASSTVAEKLSVPTVALAPRKTPQEMAQCYCAADLTIVTSAYETFGRIAAESQFCGTPVLAFATGGLSEVLDHGRIGWLVPTGDLQQLVQTLRRLMQDTKLLAERVDAMRAFSLERFSNRHVVDKYVSIYESLIV